MEIEVNPWDVPNLEEFLYYCCPQCDLKVKECQTFVEHALVVHEKARQTLIKVKDDYEEELSNVHIIAEDDVEHVHEADEEDFKPSTRSSTKTECGGKTSKSEHQGDWQCYVCGHLKSAKNDISEHIKDEHYAKVKDSMMGPPRGHQCSECKIMFPSSDSLGLHVCGEVPMSWTGKAKGAPRKCPKCDATFKKNYALLRHVAMKHTKEKNFACDQCDYKASLPTLLKKHQARVHSDRERSHLCNLCGSMYMEKTQLWAHIAYIHGKSVQETMCFHCGKIVRTDTGLKKHIKEAHGKDENRTPSSDTSKPFKCESCLQEFAEIGDIRKHFRDEHKQERGALSKSSKNEPRYPCSECDRVFYTKSSMEGHFNRVHAKERKYPCTRCSEAFFDPRSLKIHADQHDGINQHKCNICWKQFKNKFLCDRHVKTVHEKNEIYVCDTCGFKTFHAYSLTAHVQQVHQKYRPNKCDFCDDAFFYKRDKEKHMAKAHGTKETW